MLFVFPEITSLNYLWSNIAGIFAIIRPKATKLKTLKMPATMYSWKAALTVKVIRRVNDALKPNLLHGK